MTSRIVIQFTGHSIARYIVSSLSLSLMSKRKKSARARRIGVSKTRNDGLMKFLLSLSLSSVMASTVVGIAGGRGSGPEGLVHDKVYKSALSPLYILLLYSSSTFFFFFFVLFFPALRPYRRGTRERERSVRKLSHSPFDIFVDLI